MEHFHIIIEKNIPFIRGVFDDIASVSYLAPEEITREAMKDADALVTRTRTRCDRNLLEGSRCRIIASATIGLDHIDTRWCSQNGISVQNAPGCNAPAVAQYVFASIISAYGIDLRGLTLGIVGVGHVGSIVKDWGERLGMTVMGVDPPRAEVEKDETFHSLEETAATADIITVHTPYTRSGAHATHHLFDSAFFSSLKRSPMVINSARGAIIDTPALKEAMKEGRVSRAVIDCWENEPDIDRVLLDEAYIATPHIAGYSREGKIRATVMAATAVAEALGLPKPVFEENVAPGTARNITAEGIAASYDPFSDTALLRATPEDFERLRNTYDLRPEVAERP